MNILSKQTPLVIAFFFALSAQVFTQPNLGKNYAVFFGVEDYNDPNWPDLKYPIEDVTTLAGILSAHYAFDTIVLRNPDRAAIFAQLAKLKNINWSPRDQLLLFFSGHGKEGYFIPKDGQAGNELGSAVGFNNQFINSLNDVPCQHQLVVIDACYSGSFLTSEFRNETESSWKNRLLGDPEESQEDKNDKILCQHFSRKTRLSMTSSEAKSKAPDRSQLAKQFKAMLESYRYSNDVLYTATIYQRLIRERPTPLFDAFHFENEEASSFIFVPEQVRKQYESPSPRLLDPDKCKLEKSICALCPKAPDNQIYEVLPVDRTLWLTQNLDFNNSQSFVSRDCDSCGGLYTWTQAQEACETLGKNWRLPTENEWIRLSEKLGDGYAKPGPGGKVGNPRNSYKKLIESNWKPVLAGYYENSKEAEKAGREGCYWTSSDAISKENQAVVFCLSKQNGVMRKTMNKEKAAVSVRCVRSN